MKNSAPIDFSNPKHKSYIVYGIIFVFLLVSGLLQKIIDSIKKLTQGAKDPSAYVYNTALGQPYNAGASAPPVATTGGSASGYPKNPQSFDEDLCQSVAETCAEAMSGMTEDEEAIIDALNELKTPADAILTSQIYKKIRSKSLKAEVDKYVYDDSDYRGKIKASIYKNLK